MKLTKILSGVLTAAMVGTMLCSTAFAAEPANGEYTGEIHFLNGKVRELRVCVILSLHMRQM